MQGSEDCNNEGRLTASGQDMGNFGRSQEGAWLTAWGVIRGPGKGSFPVREQSRSACSLYD